MNEKNSLEIFCEMSIPKAVIKNTLPAMSAMIMILIYNLADTFFIGQTNDVYQVAAVSLITPVFLAFMSVGTVFGIGGTSVISRAIGEERYDYSKKVTSFCMWGCVVVGVVMSGVFLIYTDPILNLIGASSDTFEYAKTYLQIVAIGGPFVLIANCFSNILRAEGQTTKAMMGVLIGNIINIVLDPILILVLGLNIGGAAIATVVGNLVGAGYYLFYFWSGKSTLSIRLIDFDFKNKIASGVLMIGIPAALGSLLMSVASIVANELMAGYGDVAVASLGVAMKIVMISGMVSMGVGQGVQPLLGYCVGAKDGERFRGIMKFSLKLALGISVVLTGICYIFDDKLIQAFLTDAEAISYTIRFTQILLSTSVLFGAFYVLIGALQAIGATIPSLLVNISRQGLIFIPALFLLNSSFGMYGIVWAQPIADILSFALVVLLYNIAYKKMNIKE